jgi:hypothetical protein
MVADRWSGVPAASFLGGLTMAAITDLPMSRQRMAALPLIQTLDDYDDEGLEEEPVREDRGPPAPRR